MVANGWRYEPLLAASRFLFFAKLKVGDMVIGINIGLYVRRCWPLRWEISFTFPHIQNTFPT